ncbi:NERD domain-containing protein [Sporolactobacillus sp. STSJ-5]|uniref:NERD domain-containing protein n=1 Tax=Sporolactobacillus sp. STSJ-5 TaxID=2965076 RepID=UPI0021082388|nr:NERD domain-containing protein [Sporolactobacillus sp. STSJ-5]MCQ2009451.1 NERD domain-containing protein [Sporolactobacillus sp. STSJ-5]
MFLKTVEVPVYIEQYQAYVRRLPPSQLRHNLESQFKKYWTGFRGEQMLEPLLASLPDKEYLIFHDLRLFNGVHYFQIDYLILTAKFILVLEVKNIAGTLTLDFLAHILTRLLNNKREIFQDPTVQSEMLKKQLQDWLAEHCGYLPGMPVEDIVVFASPSTFIRFINAINHEDQKVIRSSQLKKKTIAINNQLNSRVISSKMLKSVSKELIKGHHPKTLDLIRDGTVSCVDLIKGVRCPHCDYIPMIRLHRNWKCPSCRQTAPKAYFQALQDYRLLMGPKITTQDCKQFLQLESTSTSKYLLQTMHPNYTGNTSNRTYYLTEK